MYGCEWETSRTCNLRVAHVTTSSSQTVNGIVNSFQTAGLGTGPRLGVITEIFPILDEEKKMFDIVTAIWSSSGQTPR
jgi:hypothetical protein